MLYALTMSPFVLAFAGRDDDVEERDAVDGKHGAEGLGSIDGWGLGGSPFCIEREKTMGSLAAGSATASEPNVGARMGAALVSPHCGDDALGTFDANEPNCAERDEAETGAGAVRKDDDVPNWRRGAAGHPPALAFVP